MKPWIIKSCFIICLFALIGYYNGASKKIPVERVYVDYQPIYRHNILSKIDAVESHMVLEDTLSQETPTEILEKPQESKKAIDLNLESVEKSMTLFSDSSSEKNRTIIATQDAVKPILPKTIAEKDALGFFGKVKSFIKNIIGFFSKDKNKEREEIEKEIQALQENSQKAESHQNKLMVMTPENKENVSQNQNKDSETIASSSFLLDEIL